MATRFYLPSTGTTGISPTVGTQWDSSSSTFFRAPMSTSKRSTAMRTDAQSVTTGTEECYAQFVSQPLQAQSLAANSDVSWSIRGIGSDAKYEVVIRVIASNGTTVRGTFYAAEGLGNYWTGSLVSQYHTVTTATSAISIQSGDYLVFEVGVYSDSTTTYSMRFGDAAASDLSASDGDSDDDNPWIEFEHNFTFIAPSSLSYTTPVKYFNGTAISANNPTVTGTVHTYSVSAGALPSGITVDTSTGVISGTPSQSGSYPATISAANDGGSTTFDVLYYSPVGCTLHMGSLIKGGISIGV